MWDVIAKYWVTWACGIIAGAFVIFRKKVVNWYKVRKQKKAADEFADRYVLFLKLKEIYKEAQEQGYITIDDMDDAEQTYRHYHILGGNGKATLMVEVLREMEKR